MKLCIFDLDGTLINSVEDLAISTNQALVKHHLPTHAIDQYYHFVGNGIVKLIERASGFADTTQQFELVYNDFMNYYEQHSMDKTYVYEGITDVLRQLNTQGVLCAVLSNKPDEFVKQLIDQLFSDRLFVRVLGKNNQFPTKPDPASLNALIEELCVNKSDCIYVGDSNVDVYTAHNAGIRCIGVAWGFRGKEELVLAGTDYLAEKPFDILRYL